MSNFDFDAWRAGYDAMSYQDHLATYSELWRLYPVQQHFDAAACGRFLDITRPATVLEVGGWEGALASVMLATCPWIESWRNVEICREAVEHSLCTDARYLPVIPPQFLWDGPELACDALVMSHSPEHMRWSQLRALLERVSFRAVYLASPLPEDGSPPDWDHYPGTHVLEVGWHSIGALLGGLGFREMVAPRTREVRGWAMIGSAG